MQGLGRAIAVVVERDDARSLAMLRELGGGWEEAITLLRLVEVVVAIAATRERIRRRAPIVMGIRSRADIPLYLQKALALVKGTRCQWVFACGPDTELAARAIVLADAETEGTA